jgi:hypothetical protein
MAPIAAMTQPIRIRNGLCDERSALADVGRCLPYPLRLR